MCTLAVAWRALDDAPVVVAANRDEALDRPAEPPDRRVFDGTAVVAPLDARAGGTWTGYNEDGLFAGVTNRWGVDLDGERSRGLLVRDALAERSVSAARETVERALAAQSYGGFHLVLAGEEAACLLEWDGDLRVEGLSPGVTVVVNVGAALPDGETLVEGEGRRREQADAARRLRAHLAPGGPEGPAAWLGRAAAALSDHEFGACVHRDRHGFGTRSSSLLAFGDHPTYRFADGPPCETAYRAVDEQL